MKRFNLFPFLLFVLVGCTTIYAQTLPSEKLSMTAVRIDKKIEINGKLDNPVWKTAVPIELKYEVTPGDNTPAKQKTLVYALYDEKNLYFGFKCFDTNPELIRANITDRDNIFQDDYVIVLLDTYGDYQRSYELAVNPYGIKGDLMRAGDNEDDNFDMIWDAYAARNSEGWTAEMAIPFTSLNFSGKAEQNWVLEIIRTVPRASRTQISWTPLDRSIPSLMTQAGVLKGLKDLNQGSSIELLPYAMGQKAGALINFSDPNSGMKFNPVEGRFGGGIKYSPSANFSLDAVINPDFSQIEADAAQISVNTTFALNYEEKRPFFLTGKELLPNKIYYSRSINDPLYAGRVLGKSGALTYMYMGAYDRNTVFVVPGEDNSSTIPTNMKSVANIGRARYDFGNENYVGAMLFTRNMEGGHNYMLGVDWKYKFWSNWYVSGSGYLSQTKEMNDPSLFGSTRKFSTSGYDAAFNGEEYTGTGLSLALTHSGRVYNFNISYNDYSPTYQTYNGLYTSVGNRQFGMGHGVVIYPENSFIDKATISVQSGLRFNYEGRKKEQYLSPGISLTMKGQTSLNVSYLLINDENFFGTQLTGANRAMLSFSTRPINEISFSCNAQIGEFIYRTSVPSIGKGHNISASMELKPTSQLNIQLSYSRAQLGSREVENTYYDGNIYRAVGIYQFTPEIFFRTILQYSSFNMSFNFYPLFSYKLNAFTTFFAGATSNYSNYEGDFGFVNTDQQYFVKMQYLIGI